MAIAEIIKKRGKTQSQFSKIQYGHDAPKALPLPKLEGSQQFRHLVHALGGVTYVSKQFRMAQELVSSYLTGEIEPPYTVLCALYWHSHYGFSEAFSAAHWTHDFNSFRRTQAEEKSAYLERCLEQAIALLERRPGAVEALKKLVESSEN